MAYNPFDFFRRNQKILFAVLTVFIMIMFTLSWGANDFFQWFPKWLGTRSSGDVMAVVGGSKVRSSDLEDVRRARKLANQFMATAAGTATNKLMKELDMRKSRVSEEYRATINDMLRLRNGGAYFDIDQVRQMQGLAQQNPMLAQIVNQQLAEMLSPRAQAETQKRLRIGFGKMATAGKNEADKEAGIWGQALMALDGMLAGKQGQYFSDTPDATYKDAIDFLLWKKKADQLGIRFTREDVDNLIDSDLGGQLDREDRAKILGAVVEDRRRQNPNDVYDALADEFRVRAAQQAMLGASTIRANTPVPVSADQTFARFNELTGEARWSVATIPVEKFASQVQGAPTAQEIQDIFRRGQNAEPDPLSPRPAFKKPRELKVAYLEVTGKEAYYAAAAADAITKFDPAFNAGALLVVPFGGSGFAQLAGVGISTVPDKGTLDEYKGYKEDEAAKAATWPARQAFGTSTDVTAANLYKPDHLAALIGLSAVSPLTAAVQVQAKAERLDDTHRIASQLLPLAPAALGGPAGFAPNLLLDMVSTKAYPLAVAPKPLPASAVRDYLAERMRINLQTSVLPIGTRDAPGDLNRLMRDTQKAVTDAGDDKAKGRAAAKALVDAFVATRKLTDIGQVGASTKFADMFGVGSDPGLAKLKDRFALSHAGMMNMDRFGHAFFKEERGGQRGMEEVDSQRFFQPRPYPESRLSGLAAQSQFLVWLTDEIPATVPKPADVKDRVEAEWRKQKARAEAKKAAEKLATDMAAAAKEKPGEVEVTLAWPDLVKKAELGPPFGLPPMSELPLRLTEDKKGYTRGDNAWPPLLIPHPSDKAEKDLIDNVNKPFGTTVVFSDQPETNFYVATLTGRKLKTATEFADAAYAPIGKPEENPAGQGLPLTFAEKARKAAMDDALALLRSEFGYTDENPKVNDKANRD